MSAPDVQPSCSANCQIKGIMFVAIGNDTTLVLTTPLLNAAAN